ncbi:MULTISPECIES: glycosyltransferase family 39 protein [Streptacidiphilus]|uniref:Phospholipid carrier-dependent glycosyltransferase n=1 Tax=Streptacidiphilus cavernicola TaxID=3342716 RepID=A0ABV6UGE9_9ACTN|nr:phospholipid carrier-dependent glycosyltransferase [Streptacidiphilus jeojiense]
MESVDSAAGGTGSTRPAVAEPADRAGDRSERGSSGVVGSRAVGGRAVLRGRGLTSRAWFLPAALVAAYLVQVAFRLALVTSFTYPSVHPDEDAYLVLARILAGGRNTYMPAGEVLPGGYPLLITPALWLGHSAETAYRLVLVTNALLNALVMPATYMFLRRLALGRKLAFLAAFGVALINPVVFYSQFAMTDVIFPLLVLCWLFCMHAWLSTGGSRRSRAWYGAGSGLAASYAMATHDRGGVMVAITCAVLLLVLVLRWVPWAAVFSMAAGLALGVGLDKFLVHHFLARTHSIPSAVGTAVFQGLFDRTLLDRNLSRTLGQFWYFCTSTWGLGALAIVLCAVALFGRGSSRPNRVVAGVMLATLFGVALASASGLPSDTRVDTWVYARYLTLLAPAMFAVGLAGLVRLSRTALIRASLAAVVLTVGLTAFVVVHISPNFKTLGIVPWGLPDALILGGDTNDLHVLRTTVVSLLLLALVVVPVVLFRRKALLPVLVCVALLAAAETVAVTEQISKPWAAAREWPATGFMEDAGITPTDNVVLTWSTDWTVQKVLPYEVFRGSVWVQDPTKHLPAAANVAVVKAPDDQSEPLAASWPDAPAGWYPVKAVTSHGSTGIPDVVVWRKK